MDSDEEEPLAAISGSAEERAAAKIEADDAEIELVRKRIAEARLNAPDGELEKLQHRQRGRIERHNSRVGSIRSFDMNNGGASSAGPMGDLMDLNFDDDGTSGSKPLGGGAGHAQRGMTASESANSGFNRGALSDYSDYDESDESDEETHRRQASGTAEASRSTRPDGSSWTNLNEEEEAEWLQTTQSHRPKIGPGFSWNEDEDEDDPFADPFADSDAHAGSGAGGWGIQRPQNEPRREWAAV